MSATVRVMDKEATLDGWEWTGDEPLADILNAILLPGGPSGGDPAPEYHEAERAIGEMGMGKVVRWDEVEFDPDAIY